MKTFISLSIDYEHPNDTSVVVFQAENEEAAVLAVAEDIIGESEIDDFVENGEPGDSISDFVNTYMFEDYPVIIAEVKSSAPVTVKNMAS